MKITNDPSLRQQVYDNVRAQVVKDRPGIHVSDLIYCTRKAYYRRLGLSPQPGDDTTILWLTGYAFQEYMYPLDEEIPIICDGIICTPDIARGIEVKTTRSSMSRFDPYSMGHWHRQILAYCKALDRLEYDLVVLFICGNYSPPFPALDCWHIQVTQEEVDSNWEQLLARKQLLEKALWEKMIPDPNPEDWEGNFCESVDLCQDTPCHRRKKLKGRM